MAKTALEQWDETNANNSDIGGTNIAEGCAPSGINNAIREEMAQIAAWLGDDTLASGATTDLGSVPGRYVSVTGTTTITALGTIKAGTIKYVKFSGVLTLTHNATSLILPGSENITTAAGDVAIMVSEGSGNWRCASYTKSAYMPAPLPKSGAGTGQITVFSGASGAQWTLPADGVYFYYGVRFSAAGAVSAINSNIGTAGGTVVGSGVGGEVWRGFSWRIS